MTEIGLSIAGLTIIAAILYRRRRRPRSTAELSRAYPRVDNGRVLLSVRDWEWMAHGGLEASRRRRGIDAS